ncbi:HD domain-containing protein [Candidatus Saccharibacteria bacterium]|nr:HD domain-containing protein [Candidatus Saccharibacteria bacterium]
MTDSEKKIVFRKVMEHEEALSAHSWDLDILSPDTIMDDLQYITAFITSGTVSRSFNSNSYNKTAFRVAPESVAAHALLVSRIASRALERTRKPNFRTTRVFYTKDEILEAVLRHDLPENVIGDIPDDGTRNDIELSKQEQEYWMELRKHGTNKNFEKKVYRLLKEMQQKSSRDGRLIYTADKASAILRTLYEDKIGAPARMSLNYEHASDNDKKAMAICDDKTDGKCRASEMWTVNFFKLTKSVNCDETGYMTALIVMMTLEINGKWYDWRADDYLI